MFKQSPSRNNRSKGLKAKHILQICLLLAVCFWLIYQVKRSHDKKEEFDTEDEKVVGKVQSDAEILRLGRKELPRITETDTDERLLDEEEDNKHEDDEQDIEDNISDDREDEIDANDLEKVEVEKGEPAHEKEHVDEDNERDDNEEIDDVEDEDRSETEEHEEAKDDHGEAEEDEGGSKDDHDEGDVKLEEQVHDGDGTNTREAREEQYNADDASSEVAHDNQTIMPEVGNISIEHKNEIWGKVGQENETVTSNMEDVGLQPKNNPVLYNGTIEDGSGNENLTTVENILKHINNSEAMDDEKQSQPVAGSNSTTESLLSDDISSSFRNMNDTNTMSAEGGGSEDIGTVDSDEGASVILYDPIDASDSTLTQDEKDSRMDLDTLPEITTEVQNTDDAMAE